MEQIIHVICLEVLCHFILLGHVDHGTILNVPLLGIIPILLAIQLTHQTLVNSEWMSEDEYQTGFDQLMSRAALPENKGLHCNATINNLIYSLNERTNPAYRKKMLLKTMEGGRWSDPNAPGYWDLQSDMPVLDFVKEILTAKEIAKLVPEPATRRKM